MRSSSIGKRLVQAAVVAVIAFVGLVLFVGVLVMRSGPAMSSIQAELAASSARHPLRAATARAEVVRLARDTRIEPPARIDTTSPVGGVATRDVATPSPDPSSHEEGGERAIHDWLRDIRLTREQPGPAPTPEVVAALRELAPSLDVLAEHLSRTIDDASAPFVDAGDMKSRAELERAHVLLLAAAGAESLDSSGDPVRGERLLEAAWTMSRGMPVGIDDAGPGDLFLAILRQVRVADARRWSDRLEEPGPQSRLADALEWDAKERIERWSLAAARRQKVQSGWVPATVQRFLGDIESKHDRVFTARIARSETTLAGSVRALGPCDDPWTLSDLRMLDEPIPAEVRLRVALASASLAQADVALTRHVLLRRHGLDAPRDACGTQPLKEQPLGENRFVVGWRIAGSEKPGPADRDRPRNDAPRFRTWPEPSVPGPPLGPFTFEVMTAVGPVGESVATPSWRRRNSKS
jgi:hypothetical protein